MSFVINLTDPDWPGQFEVMYEDGVWRPVGLLRVREVLARSYDDLDAVMKTLRAGLRVGTTVGTCYRYTGPREEKGE